MKKLKEYIVNGLYGFVMALADSVPGVSGGTIAFLLGFYDNFINSLNAIISKNKEERKQGILFLIKLGIGWIIGMIASILILTSLFEKEIYKISSLFLGFIILSIPIIISEEKKLLKGKYLNIIFTFVGIALVSIITYFNSSTVGNFDITNLNIGTALYIFFVGAIAISAMVLPGISGSTLLLIFGIYIPIMTGVKDLLHFNFSSLTAIIIFGIGVLVGIFSVIKLLKKALEKYRVQTIYTIIGLMIGSLYSIVMGPTTLKVPMDPMSLKSLDIIFFIIGGLIVFLLQKMKKVIEPK